jgi:hypothetical protein
VRDGTAKQLTLVCPASGEVRVKGVRSAANAVLHPWLQAELTALLATLPEPQRLSPAENRRCWERWQEGLTVRTTLPQELPPLRMLLVLDNLTGHYTVDFVLWLFAHGIMPLYTPLSGSWLNMAESVQRILDPQATGPRWPASADPRGDHRLAGSGRTGLESGADAVYVGWQAPSTAPARTRATPYRRRSRSLYLAPTPPDAGSVKERL